MMSQFATGKGVSGRTGGKNRALKDVGLVGLLETKVKEKNVHSTTTLSFSGWQWIHNFSYNTKGRIWISWRPSTYGVELVNMTEEMIHYHLQRNKHFFIAFVCGLNQDNQRLAQFVGHCKPNDWSMNWGQEIADLEIKDFAYCIEVCELTEMRSTGAYFSWTNKIIWSRIDRVFTNPYCTLKLISPKLHNYQMAFRITLLFSYSSMRPQATFHYCTIWEAHKDFMSIVESTAKVHDHKRGIHKLRDFLDHLKKPLRKINKDKYADLHEQQTRSRERLTKVQQQLCNDPTNEYCLDQERRYRENYIKILSSVMALIKQQYKIEWIQYGDDRTRYFSVGAKGRKRATYIYNLDDNGVKVEGFKKKGGVILDFYKNLLDKQYIPTASIDPQVIEAGHVLTVA
ncbi:LOW QUALITY PROTEIN: hypothetical protein Cgig2_001190 [Carnegiea gigantea]|uniref:Uncharacterized protein n=1 Tax=Carnegiea gigantea TaxID=171969 RepID=A0A9Q1K0M1_9CARY|nr:LOW QUALITY PROTEIN: hypothetical protein Cgig2_001190 [Carnegiea gigantea]